MFILPYLVCRPLLSPEYGLFLTGCEIQSLVSKFFSHRMLCEYIVFPPVIVDGGSGCLLCFYPFFFTLLRSILTSVLM